MGYPMRHFRGFLLHRRSPNLSSVLHRLHRRFASPPPPHLRGGLSSGGDVSGGLVLTTRGNRKYMTLFGESNRGAFLGGHVAASSTMTVRSAGSRSSTGSHRSSWSRPSRTANRAEQSPATKAICSPASVAYTVVGTPPACT